MDAGPAGRAHPALPRSSRPPLRAWSGTSSRSASRDAAERIAGLCFELMGTRLGEHHGQNDLPEAETHPHDRHRRHGHERHRRGPPQPRLQGHRLRPRRPTRRRGAWPSSGPAISIGHRAENVRGADVVVVSSAVRDDNVEVDEARRLQIPVIPRAEMLAELMRMKMGIAVAGSHGKTTTTSMIAAVLDKAGFDPTIVVGGRLNTLGANARLGRRATSSSPRPTRATGRSSTSPRSSPS